MATIQLPETRNETIMIIFKGCVFSENIFAWFDANLNQPVFADNIKDLMLPEDRVMQKNCFSDGTVNKGAYNIFHWDDVVRDFIYSGRLYVPEKFEYMIGL